MFSEMGSNLLYKPTMELTRKDYLVVYLILHFNSKECLFQQYMLSR